MYLLNTLVKHGFDLDDQVPDSEDFVLGEIFFAVAGGLGSQLNKRVALRY